MITNMTDMCKNELVRQIQAQADQVLNGQVFQKCPQCGQNNMKVRQHFYACGQIISVLRSI